MWILREEKKLRNFFSKDGFLLRNVKETLEYLPPWLAAGIHNFCTFSLLLKPLQRLLLEMLRRSPSLILPPTCHFLMNIDLGMKLMKPSVCESEAKRLLGIYLGCQTLGRRYVSVRLITDVQSLDPSRWSVKHPLARSVLSQPISRWLASVSAWPGLTCITSSPSRESQLHRKEVRSLKNMSGPLTSPGYYVPQKIHLTLLCVSGAARSAANCARLPGGPCTGRSRTVAAHTGETCGLPSTTGRDTKTRTGSRTWRTWRTFWRAAWNGSRSSSDLVKYGAPVCELGLV